MHPTAVQQARVAFPTKFQTAETRAAGDAHVTQEESGFVNLGNAEAVLRNEFPYDAPSNGVQCVVYSRLNGTSRAE